MPIRLQGHHPHASAQGLPARCPLWSRGWYPWASLPDVQSGVMGGACGSPCLVSTLESWAPGQMETGGHLITIYKYPKGRLREEEVIKFHMFQEAG